MIVEKLDNWRALFNGPAWEEAFTALENLTPDAPEGKVDVRGEDIYYRVADTDTRLPDRGTLEAHRDYLDIHLVLRGAECIDWYPAIDLKIKSPYHAERDMIAFERPGPAAARVCMAPGLFAVMFPSDAHMALVAPGGEPAPIRKVVVKLRASLVGRQK